MKGFITLAIFLAILGGCAQPTHKATAERATEQTTVEPIVEPTVEPDAEPIVYKDMSVFDETLSNYMSSNPESINVTTIGSVSVNDIPERLGIWLSVVENKGGKVELQSTTKAIPVVPIVLGTLPTVYKFIKKERIYGGAAKYDATILHDANGVIEKVVFTNRATSAD